MIKYETNINDDILGAELLLGCKTTDPSFSSIYLFTNENLRGVMDLVDADKKDALTVCGSGDHVLNLAQSGAKKIDVFDRNKLTYYYLDFKRACALSLKYDEFKKTLLGFELGEDMEKEKFKRISRNLSQVSKDFWDWYSGAEGCGIYKGDLFNMHDLSLPFEKSAEMINPYFDKDNYATLQKNLETCEINFTANHVYDAINTDKKYDVILLSNIARWVGAGGFLQHVKKELPKIMNDDATAQVHYLYDANPVEFTGLKTNVISSGVEELPWTVEKQHQVVTMDAPCGEYGLPYYI